jgi:hypothetical protein
MKESFKKEKWIVKEPLTIKDVLTYEELQGKKDFNDKEIRKAFDGVLKKTDRVVTVRALTQDDGFVELNILVTWRDDQAKVVGYFPRR